MSDDLDLAPIEARHRDLAAVNSRDMSFARWAAEWAHAYLRDVPTLLAEIKRLRTRAVVPAIEDRGLPALTWSYSPRRGHETETWHAASTDGRWSARLYAVGTLTRGWTLTVARDGRGSTDQAEVHRYLETPSLSAAMALARRTYATLRTLMETP